MKSVSLRLLIFWSGLFHNFAWFAFAAPNFELSISSRTGSVEADNAIVYYSSNPLLVGNDAGAATGGFHVWSLDGKPILNEVASETPGRTKLVAVVYDVGGKDLIITIAQTDSIIRVFDVDGVTEIKGASKKAIGDWSALCSWKSAKSGNQYFYLFGKKQAVQYLITERPKEIEIVEVRTFNVPLEVSSCAISSSNGQIFFSGDDSSKIYTLEATESTKAPTIGELGNVGDGVTGLAVYVGKSSDYLLVAQSDAIDVYSTKFVLLGSMSIIGSEDVEVQGLSIYQGKTTRYAAGFLAYAIEDQNGKAFAVSPLESAFKSLKLETNIKFDPSSTCINCKQPVCDDCNLNGFCIKQPHKQNAECTCFPGFGGKSCKTFTCTDNCSGHGKCVGANECRCEAGWGGLHCSFRLVQPQSETDSSGGDGDDPAIWISPSSADLSRIITTTKSEEGAGFSVFDLTGKLLQTQPAEQPNNVDIIYGFRLGDNRIVDLTFAACRGDNTLCLFEISANGTLTAIPGGVQPVIDDYEVYGSCAYRSPKTGTQYLFVNNKDAEYLQYSLTSTSGGTLSTTLVRKFLAGSGGQVEGCVTDEDNGFLFVGEEPQGLWRYNAEPDTQSPGGINVASVATYGDYKPGDLFADVEGVTLVYGKTPSEGFIIVSCQGVSAYNIYERAPPHAFVETFTLIGSENGRVDHVSNTDGIAAVGNRLSAQFPAGLIVVHDDANELSTGGTAVEASFKLVSLKDVLQKNGLWERIDTQWDPRK